MNEIRVFNNEQFGQVRTIQKDGEPWFVAVDVCRALEIRNPSDALKRLDDDEKMTLDSTEGHLGRRGGAQKMAIVNEPGLYALVLGSRKPEARVFRRWITHEVIPTIRKTGGYMMEEEGMTDDELMARALAMASEKLRQRDARIAQLAAENCKLTVQKQIMQPKADYFDELVDRNLLTGFRETAKQLGVKEKEFVQFLIRHKYIYRDKKGRLMPYAEKNEGLFELKETYNEKTNWRGTQTLITPRGREIFRLLTQGMA